MKKKLIGRLLLGSTAAVIPLLVLVLTILVASRSPAAAVADDSFGPFSADSVAADLEVYIPTQLEVVDVPGVAIALIRDGTVIWEAGFGVANTCSGETVRPHSVFEVASLSKPVAAYAALTLVDDGLLELDKPVYPLFEEPWLPRSEWSDQVTLRHLLTHTAGMSKRLHPLDKSIAFPPGERYEYSNAGYEYVQAVIEEASGSPLESVANEAVFGPLGMSSSTFADDPEVISRLVCGHISYGTDLAALVAVLAICFVIVFVLGIGIQRFWKKRIAVTWRLLGVFYAIAAVASLPLLAWLNGGFNKWWVFFLIVLSIFSVWVVAWIAVSRLLIRHYSEEWRNGVRLWILRFLSLLGCLAVFALAANAISGPVPKRPLEAPSAAYSLKTTAGDLARFMIELSDSEHLDPDTAAEMATPQAEIGDSDSQGLGIAIYHGQDNDWLWHTGDNADFHTLMMMCPATGDGVVVLANGQNGFMLNGNIARRALGVHLFLSGG